jgi:hypothetical protein
MKILIMNALVLGYLTLSSWSDKNLFAKENTSEVVFRFKTTELLRFSLKDCPASISAKSHVFPKGTIVSIQLNEPSSQNIYYQMDGATEQPYTEPIRLVAKGQHVITMWILNSPDDQSILNSIKFQIVE